MDPSRQTSSEIIVLDEYETKRKKNCVYKITWKATAREGAIVRCVQRTYVCIYNKWLECMSGWSCEISRVNYKYRNILSLKYCCFLFCSCVNKTQISTRRVFVVVLLIAMNDHVWKTKSQIWSRKYIATHDFDIVLTLVLWIRSFKCVSGILSICVNDECWASFTSSHQKFFYMHFMKVCFIDLFPCIASLLLW